MRIPLSHRGVCFTSVAMAVLLVFGVPAVGAHTFAQIIDGSGDGDPAHPLDYPAGIAVDAAGNVCVGGRDSNNAFKIGDFPVFADVFESGNTSVWSSSVP